MRRPQALPRSRRDRLAMLLALGTIVSLASTFMFSKGTQFLMPGPLSSAHGAIKKCSACHTKSGSGKLSWVLGLVAGDPLADSKACLTCHKMPDTAFNAHGASAEVLKKSTERLTKIAAETPQPQSARAQSLAFPTHDMAARGLYCATCHQEHQGVNFDLNRISNEQCRSCHVVKFDSFDGHHPKFENYPFKRRTEIIYDHAGHFDKHYPEVAKKDPARRIPATCSTCHDSREDKRVMAVAPFDKTCATCHLDQIIGQERVSGPKGVAFLTLPGLDLQALKKKNAAIGEWPDASEATLTPFMRVMISRNERGRALIRTVDSLNLLDLTDANDDQVKAVTTLVWEIKGLFYALIKGKASDVLGNLNIASGAKLSADLVADLTASIPRDVLISAQQQWLPHLATEIANLRDPSDAAQGGWNPVTTESTLDKSAASADQPQGANTGNDKETLSDEESRSARKESKLEGSQSPEEPSGTDAAQAASRVSAEAKEGEAASKRKLDPQPCLMSILGACLVEAPKPEGAAGQTDAANPERDGDKETRSVGELPGKMNAGVGDGEKATEPEAAAKKTDPANAKPDGREEALSADERDGAIGARRTLPSGTPRAIKARIKDAETAAEPDGAAGKTDSAKSEPAGAASGDVGSKADAMTPATAPASGTAAANKGAEKPEEAAGKADTANVRPASRNDQPPGQATEQADDLLSLTEEELREVKAREKGAQPEGAAGKSDTANAKPDGVANADAASKAGSNTAVAEPQTRAVPVISIESDVDPESWAEYGGWYRQDYAIFYRPKGHKDKFMYSWLFLTGPQARKGDASPAAAVFDFLTSKDAQGSCTKCHSVDDLEGKGRVVNFSPPSVKSKQGRFTNFIHEPHFSILEHRAGTQANRGCLTCHKLERGQPEEAAGKTAKPDAGVSAYAAKANAASSAAAANKNDEKAGSPYLKSYEQGNQQNFVSNFAAVKKDLCQTCHRSRRARQDCLLCHKYHVNGVITPIMNTKLPQ